MPRAKALKVCNPFACTGETCAICIENLGSKGGGKRASRIPRPVLVMNLETGEKKIYESIMGAERNTFIRRKKIAKQADGEKVGRIFGVNGDEIEFSWASQVSTVNSTKEILNARPGSVEMFKCAYPACEAVFARKNNMERHQKTHNMGAAMSLLGLVRGNTSQQEGSKLEQDDNSDWKLDYDMKAYGSAAQRAAAPRAAAAENKAVPKKKAA
eukprot:CAMPEP_0118635802 /NCGR_PEP_ID=MMETSP0785-20121206/2269_1 /TAXON_ID=91992 /ORGANISM="Bolidomonas pacifica, Strain CCMP 1866" /LENGTH=212 /DNA_ID=CAMNT_0006526857 /DNA_START=74 /DNA_END=709 /DNA_ORIENTATION=+